MVATQNPIEYEGTYRLPEAQLDRFLLKLEMTYPPPQEEDRILRPVPGPRRPGAHRSTSWARRTATARA